MNVISHITVSILTCSRLSTPSYPVDSRLHSQQRLRHQCKLLSTFPSCKSATCDNFTSELGLTFSCVLIFIVATIK